jgi:hypothetical protein
LPTRAGRLHGGFHQHAERAHHPDRTWPFHWEKLTCRQHRDDRATAHADIPIKNLAEPVAHAANPGEVTHGTTGIGSDDHLAALMFERAAGVR